MIASFHFPSHSPLSSLRISSCGGTCSLGPWAPGYSAPCSGSCTLCPEHPPDSIRPGSRLSVSIPPSVPLCRFSMTAPVGSIPSSFRPSLCPGKPLSPHLNPLSPLFVCPSLPGGCSHLKGRSPIRVLGGAQCPVHSWQTFPYERQGKERKPSLPASLLYIRVTCASPTRLWEPVPRSETADWLSRELSQIWAHRGTGCGWG